MAGSYTVVAVALFVAIVVWGMTFAHATTWMNAQKIWPKLRRSSSVISFAHAHAKDAIGRGSDLAPAGSTLRKD